MNNRAEAFKKFLEEKNINSFQVNEFENNEFNHTEQEVSYL